jgi:hypothetical protein
MMRNPFRTLEKIFRLIGAPFAVAGAIMCVFGLRAESGSEAALVFFILAVNFGIIGVIFCSLSAGFWFYVKSSDAKRERLRREGLCFDAEIVRIMPNAAFRVGSSVSARAECRYQNLQGKYCLVRSGLFFINYFGALPLLSGGPDDSAAFTAKVYVSRKDPRDYYVDIQNSDNNDNAANMQADYDYR